VVKRGNPARLVPLPGLYPGVWTVLDIPDIPGLKTVIPASDTFLTVLRTVIYPGPWPPESLPSAQNTPFQHPRPTEIPNYSERFKALRDGSWAKVGIQVLIRNVQYWDQNIPETPIFQV